MKIIIISPNYYPEEVGCGKFTKELVDWVSKKAKKAQYQIDKTGDNETQFEMVKNLDNYQLIDNIDVNLKIDNEEVANEHMKHLLVEELVSDYLKHQIEFYT